MSDRLDPELEKLFGLALSLPADSPNVMATQDDVAEALWKYGEDALAHRVRTELTDDQHRNISIEAGKIAFAEGGLLERAIARGAVIVLEGADRPLARRNRRSR